MKHLKYCILNGTQKKHVVEVESLFQTIRDIRAERVSELPEFGALIFVSETAVEQHRAALETASGLRVLLTDSLKEIPRAYLEGLVDEVLVTPIRPMEFVSKVQLYQQMAQWQEVQSLNQSLNGMLERLREDVQLVERLQKDRFPQRFTGLKGLDINLRYYAGRRPGGDYFDVVESSEGGPRTLFVLTDASSYGLSSAVLMTLFRVGLLLSRNHTFSAREVLEGLFSELKKAIGPKDELSLFFGVLDRKTLRLSFVSIGSTRAFVAENERREFSALSRNTKGLKADTVFSEIKEESRQLHPNDRLILLTDGFSEILGDENSALQFLDQYRTTDARDVLNELGFKLKGKLPKGALPDQDSSCVVVDLDARMLYTITS